MMTIPVSRQQPTKPGLYIAYFPGTETHDFVHIIDSYPNGLVNTGGRTHFSRWHCLWSEQINFHNVNCEYVQFAGRLGDKAGSPSTPTGT